MALSSKQSINYHKEGHTIRRSILLNAPIIRVWEALATSEGLAAWLLPNNFQPLVGASFVFKAESQNHWDDVVECQVMAIDAPHKLTFTWSEDAQLLPTLLTFELYDLNGQTEVCLVHSQREHFPEDHVSKLDQGWGCDMLRRLAELLG